jgi:membrane protein DedA with SNARE-associated domain/rhodanese-related sulfurtransferase
MNEIIQFLTQHGTIVLFAAVLAEQIGLPVPAVPFLVAAGALAGSGQIALGLAVGSAVLASLAGDQVWFELGRRRGRQVLNWLCRISLEPASCVRRTEDFFSRHGVRSLVVAKFVPGLSTVAPPLAGIVGLSLSQYLLYNGLGTILWVGSAIGLGYLFSDQLEEALSVSAHVGPTVGLILLTVMIGYVIYKVFQRFRRERLVPRLSARQVAEKLAAGEDPMIIDLRPHAARQQEAGIPGSLALSFEDVVGGESDFPRNRDVILYCACPGDAGSVEAARILRKRGLTRVWPLTGGIEAWRTQAVQTTEIEGVSDVQVHLATA